MSGLFAKKQTINNTSPRVAALRIQNSSQGVPIAIAFGSCRVSPNLIWYGDFTAVPHTETQEQGGKGGGGTTVNNTTFTYTVAVALGVCEGEISDARWLWRGKDVEFYVDAGMTLFTGSPAQSAWGYLVTNHANQALNYRGQAYLAAEAFELGDSPSLPNMSLEVHALGRGGDCAPDANPAFILQTLMTSPQFGAGFDFLGDLSAMEQYCAASNFMISPLYNEQRSAAEIVDELARIANAGVFWSEGVLKAVPYGDSTVTYTPFVPDCGACIPGDPVTYVPDLTVQYALTLDDFIAGKGEPPVRVRRRRPADAFNMVQVSCLDRLNDYNIAIVEAKDQAAIDMYGLRPAPVINAPAICSLDVAARVAQTALQRELYYRNTYLFKLSARYARLEPMDIVSLTVPGMLSGVTVRIKMIDEAQDGQLTIEAEDVYAGVATPGTIGVPLSDGYQVNQGVAPGDANAPVIFQPPVDLSGTPQIWLGASGGPNWGGCEVWASDDDSSYARMGIITGPARYGVLTANFAASGDPDTTGTLSVDLTISRGALTAATPAQADAGDTTSFVGTATGGEIIAYSNATLTAPFSYDMDGYIRRGRACSFAAPHAIGESFMRLDAAVGRFPIDATRVGNTIYIKLLSFNQFNNALQSLADVSPYAYVVQPVGIVAVNGAIPSVIGAGQVFCIGPTQQFSVLGRLSLAGRINCDGRLIIQ